MSLTDLLPRFRNTEANKVAHMKPMYLELDRLSVVAIPGITGSGKSSTARFLISQLLLDGTEVIVCDPHGLVGKESLSGALQPLYPYLTIAHTKEEIITQFKRINRLFEERIKGSGDESRIALFLDETPAFFLNCTREEMVLIAKVLTQLANQSRKVNIRVFLLGQNWTQDYIGRSSIRNSINTIIFHRINEKEAKLFIESAPVELRRQIAGLQQGNVIVYGLGIEPTKLRVPYVSVDDIMKIATMLDESRDTRGNVINKRITHESRYDHARIDAESRESRNTQNQQKTAENVYRDSVIGVIKIEKAKSIRHAVEMIDYSIQNGMNKKETLEMIFDTTKGGRNKKWLAASKLYDSRYTLLVGE